MNASKMKNMIVIKDLPSNIIEEAYVILKPNIKLKNKDKIDLQEGKTSPEYIVKEAESVINNYLLNLEEKSQQKNTDINKMRKKYIKLKKFCMWLSILFVISLIIQIKF